MADTITPPGKDRIVPCPECHGEAGRSCYECCGDLGWDYVNGTSESAGMVCRLGCGYRWPAEDLGWRAQVLPTGSV